MRKSCAGEGLISLHTHRTSSACGECMCRTRALLWHWQWWSAIDEALLGAFQVIYSCIEGMLQGAKNKDAYALVRLVLAAETFHGEYIFCAADASHSSHILIQCRTHVIISMMVSLHRVIVLLKSFS